MVECNSIEAPNIYPNLNDRQFRLIKINEVKDYFIEEIKERELMSKSLSKILLLLIILIVLSETSGSISIASFATVMLPRSKLNSIKYKISKTLTLFRMGFFRAAHEWRGVKKAPPLPKICQTYPTMMKLGTVIPYPKKIQNIYESRYTLLKFCCVDISISLTRNHQILLYQEIQI